MTAGTYFLRAGEAFYIGSSSDFRKRRYFHSGKLKKGIHPNKRLQTAYNLSGECRFVPFEFMKPGPRENDDDFRSRLRDAEQKLIDIHKADPQFCNKSRSAFGPDNGEIIKARWNDPDYRKQKVESATGRVASETSRLRMAAAKRGAKNPVARAVVVTCPDGSEKRFPTVTDAAEFFKVTQQLFDLWLKGKVAWPGTGRSTKEANRWIIGYTAKVESCNK